jgi:hypothetical protein
VTFKWVRDRKENRLIRKEGKKAGELEGKGELYRPPPSYPLPYLFLTMKIEIIIYVYLYRGNRFTAI